MRQDSTFTSRQKVDIDVANLSARPPVAGRANAGFEYPLLGLASNKVSSRDQGLE